MSKELYPVRPKRSGFTSIPVLQFLWGLPFEDVTAGYLQALRPSSVRICYPNQGVTADASRWRVTVYLKNEPDYSPVVDRIEQEVEVALAEDMQHGHDLRCRALKLGAKF